MNTITVWTHVPYRDKDYHPDWKQWVSDHLIGIRSKIVVPDYITSEEKTYIATHSELQFSIRKMCLSVSATGRDRCRCVRFKRIDYGRRPARWFPVYLYVTDEQEDQMFAQACIDADTPYLEDIVSGVLDSVPPRGAIFYGNNALPYDYRRVVTANLFETRIIPGMEDAVWCSEEVILLLKIGWFPISEPADTFRPDMACRIAEKLEFIPLEERNL